jgi:hypothetical protein
LGTLEGEQTIMPGGGSQLKLSNWGDYSSMSIDPVDDCTFWYTVDEPNGIVGDDIIIDRLWQQQKLRTFESRNVCHGGRFYRTSRDNGIRSAGLSTQSA